MCAKENHFFVIILYRVFILQPTVLSTEETMTSSGTPPSQSLINAAVQSLFCGGAIAVAGATVVGAATVTGAVAGAVGVAGPAAAAGVSVGGSSFHPLNIVKVYHSSLVPSISYTGHSTPVRPLIGQFEVDKDCLAPEFHHDFTNIRDNGNTFRRGNQPYERPCGSYRIALKVKDKFGTDNAWLGMTGNDPGEWPVSYHGTAQHNALNIAEEGYKLSEGKRFLFGKGIYSTPELAVAQSYARRFQHDGTWYKCIIQNRVNPKYLTVIPEATNGVGIYWLSAADRNIDESELIRPYGLCLFKEGSGCTIM